MTPADRFNAIGEALFGPEWRRELGKRLEVNERQIRRWANGEYEPPEGVWADLAVLCEEGQIEASKKIAALREWSKRLKSGK